MSIFISSVQKELQEERRAIKAFMFIQTIWRDWLTGAVVEKLRLNERQKKALAALRTERRITNARFQELTKASRPTAKRDLEDLVDKGVLSPIGAGRGAAYELNAKRLKNG